MSRQVDSEQFVGTPLYFSAVFHHWLRAVHAVKYIHYSDATSIILEVVITVRRTHSVKFKLDSC